jgi:hypothetical protein
MGRGMLRPYQESLLHKQKRREPGRAVPSFRQISSILTFRRSPSRHP